MVAAALAGLLAEILGASQLIFTAVGPIVGALGIILIANQTKREIESFDRDPDIRAERLRSEIVEAVIAPQVP